MTHSAETVLFVSNLTKHYACGHKAVDNVSFSIRKGECLGLAGESWEREKHPRTLPFAARKNRSRRD